MIFITIYEASTEKGIEAFKKYFESLSRKENAVYARIRYNTSHLTDVNAHPLEYPLCIYTTDNVVFCIADVSAGYSGTGPHGMIELLDYLGFYFHEEDILRNQQIVKIDLVKNGVTLKESFKEYSIEEFNYLSKPFI